MVYNSSYAQYWLYLSNHRLASFIAEATVTDLLKLPLPTLETGREIGSMSKVSMRWTSASGVPLAYKMPNGH